MNTFHSKNESTLTLPDWLAVVHDKVVGLRYGVVQVVVHDGKVTQIERTERVRLDSPVAVASELSANRA